MKYNQVVIVEIMRAWELLYAQVRHHNSCSSMTTGHTHRHNTQKQSIPGAMCEKPVDFFSSGKKKKSKIKVTK
jgi:hypothetical protein